MSIDIHINTTKFIAPLEEVYAEAETEEISRERAEELISKMKKQGDLLAPDSKHIKLV